MAGTLKNESNRLQFPGVTELHPMGTDDFCRVLLRTITDLLLGHAQASDSGPCHADQQRSAIGLTGSLLYLKKSVKLKAEAVALRWSENAQRQFFADWRCHAPPLACNVKQVGRLRRAMCEEGLKQWLKSTNKPAVPTKVAKTVEHRRTMLGLRMSKVQRASDGQIEGQAGPECEASGPRALPGERFIDRILSAHLEQATNVSQDLSRKPANFCPADCEVEICSPYSGNFCRSTQ